MTAGSQVENKNMAPSKSSVQVKITLRKSPSPEEKSEEVPNRVNTTSSTVFTGVLSPDDKEFPEHMSGVERTAVPEQPVPPLEIVWRNVFFAIFLHGIALKGLLKVVRGDVHFSSFCIGYAYSMVVALGITAGAHRLWAHRAYKAKTPLKIFLLFLQTVAVQNSLYEWVRDHRVHHKFTETNADPHNARRGFFFSHMGWLLCKKHPDVIQKGKLVDMSDLEADPLVMWQHRYYPYLALFCMFVPPMTILHFLTAEKWWDIFYTGVAFRYVLSLHFTWLVNSAAHLWGSRPYDRFMNPVENVIVAILAIGEGWHNYHHVFPWDYKTSELGFYRMNVTTAFIDLMAKLGLAYDLKTVPSDMVRKRVQRTGDGSHPVWGWGDKDIPAEHAQVTQTLHPKEE